MNQFSFCKIKHISSFLSKLKKKKNQTINKDCLGTFVIFGSGMSNFMPLLSDILHGLYLHSFIAKVTKWKCRNICSYLSLFAKVLVKSLPSKSGTLSFTFPNHKNVWNFLKKWRKAGILILKTWTKLISVF